MQYMWSIFRDAGADKSKSMMPLVFLSTEYQYEQHKEGNLHRTVFTCLRRCCVPAPGTGLLCAALPAPGISITEGQGAAITDWCINCTLMRVMDAVKETIADVSSVSPSIVRANDWNIMNESFALTLETSITLTNTVDTPVCLPPRQRSQLSSLKSWHCTA